MSVPAPSPRSPPPPLPLRSWGGGRRGAASHCGRARGGRGCWLARLAAHWTCALVRAGPPTGPGSADGALPGDVWGLGHRGVWPSPVVTSWLQDPNRTEKAAVGFREADRVFVGVRGGDAAFRGAGFTHLSNNRNQMHDLVRRRRPLQHARLGRGLPALLPAPSRLPRHRQGGFRRWRQPLGTAQGCLNHHGQPAVGTSAAAWGGSSELRCGGPAGGAPLQPTCASRVTHHSPALTERPLGAVPAH